jgi:hypothetical protein
MEGTEKAMNVRELKGGTWKDREMGTRHQTVLKDVLN